MPHQYLTGMELQPSQEAFNGLDLLVQVIQEAPTGSSQGAGTGSQAESARSQAGIPLGLPYLSLEFLLLLLVHFQISRQASLECSVHQV